jgi:predicted TPR repeat methyltransferase
MWHGLAWRLPGAPGWFADASTSRACREAGFEHVDIEELDLRREAGLPVPGILVRARKAAA